MLKTSFYIILLFCISIQFSCKNKNSLHDGDLIACPPKISTLRSDTYDTVRLIVDQFKVFRDAVYQSKTEELKTFFDLPFQYKEESAVAYLVKADNSSKRKSGVINYENFKSKSGRLFPAVFVKLLLKVKTDSLLQNKYYETKVDSSIALQYHQIKISIENKKLIINHEARSMDIVDGHEELGSESNCVYHFEIDRSKKLKFRNLTIAG